MFRFSKIVFFRFFILFGLAFFLFCEKSEAQPRRKVSNWHHNFGLSVGGGNNQLAASLKWFHLYGVDSEQRFRIGYGFRLNFTGGGDIPFYSAPYELRKDKATTDTLELKEPQLISLNIGLYMTYSITERWLLGFNMDLAGAGFGAESPGILYSEQIPQPEGLLIAENKPQYGNLFRGWRDDLGALNTEVYVGYQLSPNWQIRGGIARYKWEFRTPIAFVRDNERYRSAAILGFIGVIWQPFEAFIRCPKQKKVKIKKLKEGEF
ncbi:MAG: hypothetical protein JJT94_09225 [Bernardetiaceae bacterium]|nr:hypothetical protein [Bernardetiaceae bacterium]